MPDVSLLFVIMTIAAMIAISAAHQIHSAAVRSPLFTCAIDFPDTMHSIITIDNLKKERLVI